jgi:hypothetical protein
LTWLARNILVEKMSYASMTYTDTTTTTSIFINDSTATITFSNTNPVRWTLTLKQGTDTVIKRGVVSPPETLSYLPARIPSHGEVKSLPANPEAEW